MVRGRRPRFARAATFALVSGALAACGAAPSTATGGSTAVAGPTSSDVATAPASGPHLQAAALDGLSVTVDGGTVVALHGGKATVTYGGASSDRYTVGQIYAEGDLNGDGSLDAATMLVDDSAGSGTFSSLLVALGGAGQLTPIPPVQLGDRLVPESLSIQAGTVRVSYLDRTDSSPINELNRRTTETFRLVGSALVEVSRTVEQITTVPLTPPDPAPVTVSPATGATRTGTIRFGQSQSDRFSAVAGQRLDVSLDGSLGLFLRVHDGASTLLPTDQHQVTWSGTLPRSGTWSVDVASATGEPASYQLSLRLSAAPTVPAPTPTASKTPQPVVTPPAPPPVTGRKIAYLTFDDGPSPTYTPQILAVLAKYHAHATFFVIGNQAQRYPSLLRAERAAGNTQGNHTWDHPSLAGMSHAAFNAEVGRTKALLGPSGSTCLRPPYGARDSNTAKYAAELGYRLQFWTIDPRDWSRPGVPAIVHAVVTQVHPGSVILMHDGGGDRSQSVAALNRILAILTAQGWSFPTPVCSQLMR